ncbi:hypothetical protein ADUPG1_008215 [Aduncisulcus paluster]|uniref:Reverse transcriptase/retrotransposon-derived protein RNase H-like domain-containing protein n=1 Tax=Aduncisulcus paluster TaxID=2918883 RepID=A0ABQ5KR49_9EUKA|nr:hypothetical protein ADUPG1_008215 [Aduncisulcus paluster]
MSPSRVTSILKIKTPQSKKQVCSFLGMINFCRDYIGDCSELTFFISQLTRKDVPFSWDKRCKDAFSKLKQKLSDTPTLSFPTKESELQLYTDASDYGTGGVLLQKAPDGERVSLDLFQKR